MNSPIEKGFGQGSPQLARWAEEVYRPEDEILRERFGECPINGGAHHRAIRDRSQRIRRILRTVEPRVRIANPILHAGINSDQVASVAKQQRVFVCRMLTCPEDVFSAGFFLAFMSHTE